jgi:hypothetical protein
MDSIKFYGQTDYDFLLNYSELMYNSDEQQYFPLSSACATIPSHSSIPIFYGRFSFDNQYKPTDKNLLSIDANQSYFGRIVNSFNQSQDIFIPHHGKWSDCWGNNVAYENGFTNQNLIDFNDNLGNTISLVAINHGVYQIVNDVITISANLSCQGTFNQGVAGHEFLLYFPLPFKNFIEGGGHGSVRFVDIANHMNIGAIVEPFDENTCLLTAKYSSAINSPTTIDIGFTFSYTIAL